MATTLYIADALNMVSKQIPRLIEEDSAAYLANQAIWQIWRRYDWRETLAELPPFWLVPNRQDYGKPFYAVPSDFLGLRTAYLIMLNSAAQPRRQELRVAKDVRETHVGGLPTQIGYVPAVNAFRVFPRTPNGIGSPGYLVGGTYKKRPTVVTAGTLNSTLLPWDDQYFTVFLAGLKWAAYDAANDPRAGGVQYNDGHAALTGQFATLHALVDEMAVQEGFELGEPAIAPSESFASNSRSGYSPYPGFVG